MAKIRGKNTAPELAVRRLAFAMGFRFRLHRRDLPGTPDLVFPRFGCVVFINGCFWHGHSCQIGKRVPKSNQDYWIQKIQNNKGRDARNLRAIKRMGWKALVVWECQLKNSDRLAARLKGFLME